MTGKQTFAQKVQGIDIETHKKVIETDLQNIEYDIKVYEKLSNYMNLILFDLEIPAFKKERKQSYLKSFKQSLKKNNI